MRKLAALAFVGLIGVLLWRFVWNQTPPPEDTTLQAKVTGQVLDSPRYPKIKMEFAPEFKYVGGHRFHEKEVADVEQHFWIEAGDDKVIKRMFWIQQQGYLPSNAFTYGAEEDLKEVQWGGLRFMVVKTLQARGSGGDGDDAVGRMRAFLRSKGYTWPESWMRARLIAIDENDRNQIMVWYGEDTQFTVIKSDEERAREAAVKAAVEKEVAKAGPPKNEKQKEAAQAAKSHADQMVVWHLQHDWDIEKRAQQRMKIIR